mgnify:CR=1 FL=1
MRANNYSNQSNYHEASQDMLQLHGDLNSGMSKDMSGAKPQHKQPGHYKQYEPTGQMQYSRIPNQYASRLGGILDGLEPVKDELRKKPFTVPMVNVKLPSENQMEASNIRTMEASNVRMAYVD